MGFFNSIKSLFSPSKKKVKKKAPASHTKKTPELKVVQGGKREAGHSNSQAQNARDKREIAAYQQKIAKMLQDDPHAQKRAAQILSSMVNKDKKSA